MSNFSAINSYPANDSWPWLASELWTLYFNDYSLQAKSVLTEWIWFWARNTSDRRINLIDNPQGDWQILNDVFWGQKVLNFQGIVYGEENELDAKIEEFTRAMSVANKRLVWINNGQERYCNATMSSLTFGVRERIYITYNITFVSQDWYWTLWKSQSRIFSNISDNSIVRQVANTGLDTKWFFVIWFKGTVSWCDTFSIKINGIWLTFTQSVSSWDLIYVDSDNFIVQHNSTKLSYNWIFPTFKQGGNELEILINWTYTADINIAYPIKIP